MLHEGGGWSSGGLFVRGGCCDVFPFGDLDFFGMRASS